MAFKLYSDAQVDQPVLCCDVCGEKINDLWNEKATGSPGGNGQIGAVTVHHRTCTPPPGAVTIPLIDFLRLFCIQNRIGDLGSDGQTDTLHVHYPTGKGFEA